MHWDDINLENTPCSAFYAYARSKLANIMFTNELAKRLKGNQ
jgi:NAD(P)-dependent dehydrogenase (short-subunit alcohol dehydrogenase family)